MNVNIVKIAAGLFIGFAVANACTVGTTELTHKQRKLICVDNRAELGEIWQDETGNKWSDMIKDAQGNPLKLTQSDADAFCKAHQGVLPDRVDYRNLRVILGALATSTSNGYVPQILPNLSLDPHKRNWFWTSTPAFHFDLNSDNPYYIFDGTLGDMDEIDTRYIQPRLAFRCLL